MNETLINILLGILIVILLIANFFVRKLKFERSPIGRVVTILDEVRKNEKLVENFRSLTKVQTFRTKRWNANRYKIDFVPGEVMKKLQKAYEACDDINRQIQASSKTAGVTYVATIDVSKVKEPVAAAQMDLREWVRENLNNPAFAPKRLSLFGNLFGGGGFFGGGKK